MMILSGIMAMPNIASVILKISRPSIPYWFFGFRIFWPHRGHSSRPSGSIALHLGHHSGILYLLYPYTHFNAKRVNAIVAPAKKSSPEEFPQDKAGLIRESLISEIPGSATALIRVVRFESASPAAAASSRLALTRFCAGKMLPEQWYLYQNEFDSFEEPGHVERRQTELRRINHQMRGLILFRFQEEQEYPSCNLPPRSFFEEWNLPVEKRNCFGNRQGEQLMKERNKWAGRQEWNDLKNFRSNSGLASKSINHRGFPNRAI